MGQGKGSDGVQLGGGGAIGGGIPGLKPLQSPEPTQLSEAAAATKALEGPGLAVSHRSQGRQAHMPSLPGHAAGAAVKLAVEDQPRSQAGAKGEKDHVPAALPRAEGKFRQGAGIRIVAQTDRSPQFLGEQGANGNAIPARQVWRGED